MAARRRPDSGPAAVLRPRDDGPQRRRRDARLPGRVRLLRRRRVPYAAALPERLRGRTRGARRADGPGRALWRPGHVQWPHLRRAAHRDALPLPSPRVAVRGHAALRHAAPGAQALAAAEHRAAVPPPALVRWTARRGRELRARGARGGHSRGRARRRCAGVRNPVEVLPLPAHGRPDPAGAGLRAQPARPPVARGDHGHRRPHGRRRSGRRANAPRGAGDGPDLRAPRAVRRGRDVLRARGRDRRRALGGPVDSTPRSGRTRCGSSRSSGAGGIATGRPRRRGGTCSRPVPAPPSRRKRAAPWPSTTSIGRAISRRRAGRPSRPSRSKGITRRPTRFAIGSPASTASSVGDRIHG